MKDCKKKKFTSLLVYLFVVSCLMFYGCTVEEDKIVADEDSGVATYGEENFEW